jgi:hypothetical protein
VLLTSSTSADLPKRPLSPYIFYSQEVSAKSKTTIYSLLFFSNAKGLKSCTPTGQPSRS